MQAPESERIKERFTSLGEGGGHRFGLISLSNNNRSYPKELKRGEKKGKRHFEAKTDERNGILGINLSGVSREGGAEGGLLCRPGTKERKRDDNFLLEMLEKGELVK